MPTCHLLCNAHLDPVWLWEWEEGAAEALSTFRCAADFCEEFAGFVFNHNEAVLYQWVEEYEPALFKRIQKLVKQGRWAILGGWYLQPDCNLPSGESFVRQVLVGKNYFREKFGVEVTTAMNVDPFGHTRGLVQILAKSGHRAYLFCRPQKEWIDLPGDDFRWIGYDGSEVLGHRTNNWYNSGLGKAAEKVQGWLKEHEKDARGIVLWGVGNHGGGPSRKDLRDLATLMKGEKAWTVRHASAADYFDEVDKVRTTLPTFAKPLNLWAPGCYTSQVRIKQGHRRLENDLYTVEALATHAAAAGLCAYPTTELASAQRDLLFCEFHDILPGSSIQPVEEQALRILGRGLEDVNRVRARLIFALAAGQKKATEGEIPVLVYNPHPWPVTTTVEVEFQLQDQNWNDTFTQVTVHDANGRKLPTQVEKELSNLTLDWRKRTVFTATLAPGTMNRFDCRMKRLPAKPPVECPVSDGRVAFRTRDLDLDISTTTGLISSWRVAGRTVLTDGAKALVLKDNEDPWGTMTRGWRDLDGEFTLLSPADTAAFTNVKAATLEPVRVIEDGPVRTVVEAIFGFRTSRLVLRYLLPKRGGQVGLEARVFWNEKDRFLKLSFPTDLKDGCRGQVSYGTEDFPINGDENVGQQWVATHDRRHALAVVNVGSYGHDCKDGELRLSLLRSSAYSALPIHDRPLVPADRNSPRIDQGERLFTFWLSAGPAAKRFAALDREALAHNRRPVALSFFPSGAGKASQPLATLDDDAVLLTACKRSADGKAWILRLHNPTAKARQVTVTLPALKRTASCLCTPWGIHTLRLDDRSKKAREVDLLER